MSPAISALFDALGDPTRRAIVSLLRHEPATVSALAEPLGITVTAVGQHLRVLEQVGLATSEKRGRSRFCRLRPEGLRPIEDWAHQCRDEWEARLNRIGSLLDQVEWTTTFSEATPPRRELAADHITRLS